MEAMGGHEPVVERRLSLDPVERVPPAELPLRSSLGGRFVRLEPLDPDRHAAALFSAAHGPGQDDLWRYLPYGPFADSARMRDHLVRQAISSDPLFFAACDRSGAALGIVSFLNIHPSNGSIEIGHIWFGFALQRTPAATEAIYLLIRHSFERGYRRVEWKCDAANQPSRRAARRFGFAHEGIFYRATVVKGRNRDTAWYSIIDEEWPAVQEAFETWLVPDNFDAADRQRRKLAAIRAAG